jgi:hypothetical protein
VAPTLDVVTALLLHHGDCEGSQNKVGRGVDRWRGRHLTPNRQLAEAAERVSHRVSFGDKDWSDDQVADKKTSHLFATSHGAL